MANAVYMSLAERISHHLHDESPPSFILTLFHFCRKMSDIIITETWETVLSRGRVQGLIVTNDEGTIIVRVRIYMKKKK